ncbi:hypothetical protein [Sphingomonas sp. OK281]|uniref:hypothetical protein n=1 Tax=Sphingomonas sp. OK281 TaxID=1881067 RepID=UPI0008E12363|nr:hypothetical protein [Sphingomonas sp. OK281]SFO17496.1 hypothetical protein SAMN05428984_2513 [Sphingomonas sp. OK281]
MTGPTKAIAIIALAVIVMVSLNIAMWRRMRGGLAAAKAGQGGGDRDAVDRVEDDAVSNAG